MFEDARSKKVILVAHCLLNQGAISDGTADFPSQFEEVITLLMQHRAGIIQLPCPELLCLGLERGDRDGARRPLLDENSRIRGLMESAASVDLLRQRAQEIAGQVADYRRHGFEVMGLIGVNRSPSCGVEMTSRSGREEPGTGVFVEILGAALAERGITLPMIGTRTSEPQRSVACVHRLLAAPGR